MTEPLETLFSTPEMSTAFSSRTHVQCMLDFEAGLARAQAHVGIIPSEAASVITSQCKAAHFDIVALYHEAAKAGTPAIPLVHMLTALVPDDAQKYVHWGATSQDVIDTAMMLQMRDGIELLITGLLNICATCAKLAEQHRHTLMAGRTLLQQALPITFGLKAARWLAMATRQVQALHEHRRQTVVMQLGGAAGTLASLGDKDLQVVALLAEELQLSAPTLPWHTERDRVAAIAATLGVIAGAMAKIASDITLLAQTEVSEVSEGTAPGKGGSSAMPQKHNPVDATAAIASARLAIGIVPVILSAMMQEHERAVGGWQAEWAAIPQLFCYTASTVERVSSALTDLQIDPAHMTANLNLTNGLIMSESLTMALAQHIGKPEAYRIVQTISKQVTPSGKSLRQVALEDEQICQILSSADLDRVLDPANYLGSTNTFINRALAAYKEHSSS